MDISQEFEALKMSSKQQSVGTHAQFVQENGDMLGVMQREGILIEYIRERDHLYITFGEPREGMAIFAGSIVVMADPDTLECIGIEVPNFKKAVESGALQGTWSRLAELIGWQRVLHIPPVVSDADDDLPHYLARGVQRELVPA